MLAINLRLFGITALCALFAACAGASEPGAESPTSTSTATEAASDTPEPASTAEYEDDAEDKGYGGWRWRGRRQDCFFVYDNQCYAKLAAACEAAGCDADSCSYDGAAPANVTCD